MNLIGADGVEFAPAYDHAEITSVGAATVIFDLLCFMAADTDVAASSGLSQSDVGASSSK
jgi:agmatinase